MNKNRRHSDPPLMNELENCINDRESMEMCMNMREIFARVSGVVDVDLAELNPTITSHPMIHTHFFNSSETRVLQLSATTFP